VLFFVGDQNRTVPTRYTLTFPDSNETLYLAACYETTQGVKLTDKAEDACSYVTLEKAAQVAKALRESLGYFPQIIEVSY
jgi:hypothetical protein